MTKSFLKDALGWGIVLWLVGYMLGIVFFFIFPPVLIGWMIMPIGTLMTLWILLKKIKGKNTAYYVWVGIVWMFIAVAFDYFFIVKAMNTNSYYKFDVYLYYTLTLALPVIVGWWKAKKTTRLPLNPSSP